MISLLGRGDGPSWPCISCTTAHLGLVNLKMHTTNTYKLVLRSHLGRQICPNSHAIKFDWDLILVSNSYGFLLVLMGFKLNFNPHDYFINFYGIPNWFQS